MNQPVSTVHARSLADAMGAGPRRVAVVASRWHHDLVSRATGAIRAEFDRVPVPPQFDLYQVPGAFEIPLHARRLAVSGRYDAIIACALVINGGIYRHEFVASAVVDALMRVQLDTDVPVFSVVLTPRDFHENEAQIAFFREHLVTKGEEAARACLETMTSLASLPAGEA